MTKVKVRLTAQISDKNGQHQHSFVYPLRTAKNIPFMESIDKMQDKIMSMQKYDKFIFSPDAEDSNALGILTRIE